MRRTRRPRLFVVYRPPSTATVRERAASARGHREGFVGRCPGAACVDTNIDYIRKATLSSRDPGLAATSVRPHHLVVVVEIVTAVVVRLRLSSMILPGAGIIVSVVHIRVEPWARQSFPPRQQLVVLLLLLLLPTLTACHVSGVGVASYYGRRITLP